MKIPKKENLLFILLGAAGLAVFYNPLFTLFSTAADSDLYSHALIVPLVSGYVLYTERKTIFAARSMQLARGAFFMVSALIVYAGALSLELASDEFMTSAILSAVVFFSGAFIMCYGDAVRKAAFPLAFLLLAVPVPQAVMDEAIFFLQTGSTEVSAIFFKASGAPVVRDGFFFHLPGLNVEVAKECSGIRSSIALVITGVIASRMFLETSWRRIALMASIMPLAMVKNGLRITALTLGGYYVDESALTGPLHNRGGVLFFLTALAIFAVILWALRRGEKKSLKRHETEFCGIKNAGRPRAEGPPAS